MPVPAAEGVVEHIVGVINPGDARVLNTPGLLPADPGEHRLIEAGEADTVGADGIPDG